MNVSQVIEVGKYVMEVGALLGGAYSLMLVTKSIIDTFASLRTFLGTDVPKMDATLSSIQNFAEVGITNHATHIQAAVEKMADGMVDIATSFARQTEDFHQHEIKDAEVQGQILEKLKDIKQDLNVR